MSTTTSLLILCAAILLLAIGVVVNAIHVILMNRLLKNLHLRVAELEYIERKKWLE